MLFGSHYLSLSLSSFASVRHTVQLCRTGPYARAKGPREDQKRRSLRAIVTARTIRMPYAGRDITFRTCHAAAMPSPRRGLPPRRAEISARLKGHFELVKARAFNSMSRKVARTRRSWRLATARCLPKETSRVSHQCESGTKRTKRELFERP